MAEAKSPELLYVIVQTELLKQSPKDMDKSIRLLIDFIYNRKGVSCIYVAANPDYKICDICHGGGTTYSKSATPEGFYMDMAIGCFTCDCTGIVLK